MTTALSKSASSQAWLAKFRADDAPMAARLADSILIVGRDEFASALYDEIDRLYQEQGPDAPPLALYAERPLNKIYGKIPAYFPNSRKGRAEGPGVPPVKVDARDQEVGSEALVANMITAYARNKPFAALSHPGPTKLRSDRVRVIVIVTDFIGSGDRIERNLESFAFVKTLQSWRSYGLIKFVVIAYSGTKTGISLVSHHRLRPNVRVVAGCPTIKSEFKGAERTAIEKLCATYPTKHKNWLGWGGTGALIAFAHGVPNNTPALFHSTKGGWTPLFPKRSTVAFDATFVETTALTNTMQRAEKLLATKAAQNFLLDDSNYQWIKSMMVLAACRDGMRSDEEISTKTFVRRSTVAELCETLRIAGWITVRRSITAVGRRELERLQRKRKRTPAFPIGAQSFYYPTQLRIP
ncbi:phosphoribosyltransferase-like protein [Rhizobium leguminosarum]|uniref:phosphoribosyltransferase-like protein n=1 Tax=Rhizobium leguminosarum TaxID=384 RepID=UPI0014429AA0|nr:hypothetical protein [Rhizobium leguminosarum]NKL59591.1 hypothetical protein [Rhizobium leguminosarum bv. viciae]